MFEQSVLTHKHQPWTMAASLTLQTSAVGALLLASMLHIERLGPLSLPDPPPPLPAANPVQLVEVRRASAPAQTANLPALPRTFTYPRAIADAADALAPAVEAPPIATAGVPGGVTGAGMVDGVINSVLSGRIARPEPAAPAPLATQETKTTAPVVIGGDVLAASLNHKVIPLYPPLARQARISGVVRLLAVVGTDGSVSSLEVVDGHPLLLRAAVEAVRQWRYRPTLLNGRPVEVTAPITVNFTLGQQ